jgi:hypothetical protein
LPVEHGALLLEFLVIRIRVVIKILVTNIKADGLLFMVDLHEHRVRSTGY